jgi:type I restriction enzyme S subunit
MSWPMVALGDIFEIARGGSPRPIDAYITDDPDGINWISIRDASNSSKYITKTEKKILPSGVSKSRLVKPGDFLLTNSMSFGRPYILRTSGCIHDGWLVLSGDQEVIDQDFFYHLLGSDLIYRKFASLAAGAVVKNLNSDLVRGVTVPLPPLSEQRRIAAILDKAEALRAKRREAIAKLDQLLQSVFLEMFGDPLQNAHEYPLVSLADTVEQSRPITYGILMPGPDIADGVPYVRVVDIRDGEVITASVRRTSLEIAHAYRRSALIEGDLLMSIRGHVGRIGITPKELEGANITQDTARISVNKDFDSRYISGLLSTIAIQRHMKLFTRGAAVKGINLKDVREIPVPVPPKAQQLRYGEIIQKVNDLKNTFTDQLEAADRMFYSLQSDAF